MNNQIQASPNQSTAFGPDLVVPRLVNDVNRRRGTPGWRRAIENTPKATWQKLDRILGADQSLASTIYELFSLRDDSETAACTSPNYVIDIAIRSVAAHAILERFHKLLTGCSPLQDFADLLGEITRHYHAGLRRRLTRFQSNSNSRRDEFHELIARVEAEAAERLAIRPANLVLRDRVACHIGIFKAIAYDEQCRKSQGCGVLFLGGGLRRSARPFARR